MVKHDEYAGLAAEKHVHKQIDLTPNAAVSWTRTTKCWRHNVPVETVVADATHH